MITIKSNRVRWSLSALLSVLILFGTYASVFSLIAFFLFVLLIVFCDKETILRQMFFVLPMATIFKMSPSSQSFFTIVLLLYVVLNFVLPRKATLLIILFTVYIVIGQLITGGFILFRTIKLIFNILFISSILNQKVQLDHKQIFYSYIFGNLVASCMGMMDSTFFSISKYTGVKDVGGIEFVDLTRFKGLYGDPNYYTIGMIISLCLIIVMYHRKEIKPVFAVLLSVPIAYFLMLTYSKSAIIMMFIPIAFMLYSFFKTRKYSSVVLFLLIVIVVVVFALSGKIEPLNVVIARFEASSTQEGVDINSLTTGRYDLWLSYIKHLITDSKNMIFGEGISAALVGGRASHNTYLDMLYFLGAIGTSLLMMSFLVILGQGKYVDFHRNFINYCVLFSILILYFFLSELFYFDPPFHIFLAFVVLNLPMDNIDRKNELI